MTKLIFKILGIVLILVVNSAYANNQVENQTNSSRCYHENWARYEAAYHDNTTFIVYALPENYDITSTNIACITSIELLKKVKNLPSKAVIALISKGFRKGYLVKWSFEEDLFLLVEVNLTSMSAFGKGTFITYPEPLERLKEVMLTKRFPKQEELPPSIRHKFKVNYVPTSTMDLAKILNRTREKSLTKKLEENKIGVE